MLSKENIIDIMSSWSAALDKEYSDKADMVLGDDWRGMALAQVYHDGFNSSPKIEALAIANIVDEFTVEFRTRNENVTDEQKDALMKLAHRSDDMMRYVCGFIKEHEPQKSESLYDRYATIMWGIIKGLLGHEVGGFPQNGWSAPSVGTRESWKDFVLSYVYSAYDVDAMRKHVQAYEIMEHEYATLASESK